LRLWEGDGMMDAFLILTPLLLLAVVALLGFAGCASFTATDSSVAPTLTLSANPATVGAGGDSVLTWSATGAHSASIDPVVGKFYKYHASNPTAPTTGTVKVNPTVPTTYTLSGTDTSGGLITVPTPAPGTAAANVASVNVVAPKVVSISPPSGPAAG